jgi:coenzyme F420-reducing hydrogenase alpha subunit
MLGARSVHPVGARVGGFHHAPTREAVAGMLAKLRAALPEAEALVAWTASLRLPDDRQNFTSVALHHPSEYAMNEGRLVSGDGLDVAISEYEQHFEEVHVPHSTALHGLLHGKPYLVGPLARVNVNLDQLPDQVRAVLDKTGISFPSRNMFHSIVARAVELHYAIVEAIRILEQYEYPDSPFVPVQPKAGVGYGCTEAPRGLLWHRYETHANGQIKSARIVPPTSQNQARIEEDLWLSLEGYGLGHSDDELRLRGETVIRNYDPCISCATHFLKVKVQREDDASA